jgi:hypothetical protein
VEGHATSNAKSHTREVQRYGAGVTHEMSMVNGYGLDKLGDAQRAYLACSRYQARPCATKFEQSTTKTGEGDENG